MTYTIFVLCMTERVPKFFSLHQVDINQQNHNQTLWPRKAVKKKCKQKWQVSTRKTGFESFPSWLVVKWATVSHSVKRRCNVLLWWDLLNCQWILCIDNVLSGQREALAAENSIDPCLYWFQYGLRSERLEIWKRKFNQQVIIAITPRSRYNSTESLHKRVLRCSNLIMRL